MTTSKQPLFLRIFKNGKLIDVKQFTGSQIVIGREGKVDAAVNDASVSPIHAMIEEREEGKFHISDLGSQTGTFVNGEKVVDAHLESGSEFQIGDMTIEFHIGVPRPKGGGTTTGTSVGKSAEIPKSMPKDLPKKAPESPAPKTTPLTAKSASAGAGGGTVSGVGSTLGMATSPSISRKMPPKGTFAPPSSAKINEQLKPGKGNVVEAVLVWGDRIINTYHFDKAGVVQIGSHPNNQIILPNFGSVRVSHPLIKVEGGATTVYLTQDMTGEVVRDNATTTIDEMRRKGTIIPSGAGYAYSLQQNEAIKINFGEGVSLVIRYVNNGPESRLLPLIDMSVNVLTGLVVGLMLSALVLFYAYLYAPTAAEQEEPEPERKAVLIVPKMHVEPVPVEVQKNENEVPKSANRTETTKQPVAPMRGEEGASKNPKPSKAKETVSRSKGHTDKAAPKAAPKTQAVPKPKDVSKSGLLGAFGSGGMQNEISRARGASQGATSAGESSTGNAPDGLADGGGNALHDVQASGTGTATYGVKGVNTAGRGGGRTGYGQSGIGAKKNASLIAGDEPTLVSGSIDKEAIRRVVQANLKQIKACYEKGLNREPGLYGKIVIQWTIGPGGRVLEAGIKSTTMNSSDVENCAVARLRTWKFPEPPAGEVAVVSYPFVFQAQE